MKRILIIGGTGMLQAATDHFISDNYGVSVVGRDMKKLKYFTDKHPDNKSIEILNLDYSDTAKFIKAIELNIEEKGNFDIVISWIHSHAQHTLTKLMKLISEQSNQAIFYHIKGSANYTNKKNQSVIPENLTKQLDYREIYLGYKMEGNNKRWLTDTEISSGVIKAVESGEKRYIVGQI